MLPRNHPDRIQITFDDRRLVANAGLILPATLALHLGLPQLVDRHLDLGDAPGRANPGDKISTLVTSALAGGDCIDDADALRTGRTACTLGCVVKASSTPAFARAGSGHLPAQLQVGPCPPTGPGEPGAAGPGLGRRWWTRRRAADHRPRFHRLRDLRRGQGRSCHHGYTGARGYHPLLAVAGAGGDVLMVRLREGRANTARGAAHFLRETVSRVRYGGAYRRPGPSISTPCARPSSLSPSGWSWLAAKTPARDR